MTNENDFQVRGPFVGLPTKEYRWPPEITDDESAEEPEPTIKHWVHFDEIGMVRKGWASASTVSLRGKKGGEIDTTADVDSILAAIEKAKASS